MQLRHRPMQPGDIRECVDIVARHPNYRSAIWLGHRASARGVAPLVRFGRAKHRCDSCRGGFGCLHLPLRCQRDCAGRFSMRAEDAAAFLVWTGINQADHERRISSSPGKLREENSRDGLNLVYWETCMGPEYEGHGEVQRYLMSAFIQEHRGYFWKEVISSQSWIPDHLDFVLKTGGHLWDPLSGGYMSTLTEDPREIVSKPHIVGLTRDLELKRQRDWAGSWVGALFDYHLPILGFNRSEQRLLSCALPGATDEQLAATLGTSLPAVKKIWISIYHRVEDCLPGLISDPLPSDAPASGRGREKRRRLLAYLREHPEELRPISRIARPALDSV